MPLAFHRRSSAMLGILAALGLCVSCASPAAASVPNTIGASPPATTSFLGIGEAPSVDTYAAMRVPAGVCGAVGVSRVLEVTNDNLRVADRAGAVISTVGLRGFLGSLVTPAVQQTVGFPQVAYDSYHQRFLFVCSGDSSLARTSFFVGVSQTSDPAGGWWVRRIDFNGLFLQPMLGFDREHLVVTSGSYLLGSAFDRSKVMILDYTLLRSGVLGVIYHLDSPNNTYPGWAPTQNLPSTNGPIYLVRQLGGAGNSYAVDRLTFASGIPTLTTGALLTRPGGGYQNAIGDVLPQSAPVSGTPSCGTPCKVENPGPEFFAPAVYHNGTLWFAHTIGLPATGTLTHTAIEWTSVDATTGAYVDGGRLEDATATATNGGKWFSNPSLAVNANGDLLVGFSQFSSAEHPSAGFALRYAADALGQLRTPTIYRAGVDYYHVAPGGGSNRWGPGSSVQRDPADGRTFWTVQNYAKARVNTDDSNSGTNGSRYGTAWARVGSAQIVASVVGPGSISPSGAQFYAYGSTPPAYVATPDPGYLVASVVVDGIPRGDNPSFSFGPVGENHTIVVTFGLPPHTVTASVIGNGTIDPAGAVSVADGSDQEFHLAPDADHRLAAVRVDGVSAPGITSATTSYVMTAVAADHTIEAVFVESVPPTVEVTMPGTDEKFAIGSFMPIHWSAQDASGIADAKIEISRDGPGGPFDLVATGVVGDTHDWLVHAPVTESACVRVTVRDSAGNEGSAVSPAPIILYSDGDVGVDDGPLAFALEPVSPNPTRGVARVAFSLPEAGRVRLDVTDVQGRTVATLLVGDAAAGRHSAMLTVGMLEGPGLYFVRLLAPGRRATARFVFMK